MATDLIKLSAEIPNLGNLLETMKGTLAVKAARTHFLEQAAQTVDRTAKQLVPPSDHRSAHLRRNIQHQVDEDKGEARIGNDLKYAPYVHGWFDETKTRTKPHWVPVAVIVELGQWAATHGLVEGATYAGGKTFALGGRRRTGGKAVVADQNLKMGRRIAAGIAKRGTPLRPYLKHALEQSQGKIDGLKAQLAQDIAKAAVGRT